MGKVLEFIKNQWKIVVAAVVILALFFVLAQVLLDKKVDVDYLQSVLEESSELTTAKLKTTGLIEFKDDGWKFFNRSDFKMLYELTVRAGINLDEVEISRGDDKKTIYVTVPKATIQDTKIGEMKFYDSKFALVNVDEKEDVERARKLAEEKAYSDAEETGILELADTQSQTLVKGILANAIPAGYKIECKLKAETNSTSEATKE